MATVVRCWFFRIIKKRVMGGGGGGGEWGGEIWGGELIPFNPKKRPCSFDPQGKDRKGPLDPLGEGLNEQCHTHMWSDWFPREDPLFAKQRRKDRDGWKGGRGMTLFVLCFRRGEQRIWDTLTLSPQGRRRRCFCLASETHAQSPRGVRGGRRRCFCICPSIPAGEK